MAERPPSWPRRLRRRAYWLLALACLGAARALPLAWGRTGGRQLASLALWLRPRERRRAEANLALAFPEMDDAQRKRLLGESAVALGRAFHDTLVVKDLLEDPRHIGEEDPGGFARAMGTELARGRGLILVTGHLGCWELLGAWVARCLAQAGQGPLAVVTGTIHNPPVDRLIQDRRRRLGMTVLPRSEGVGPLVAHLRRGGAAALLMDQNIGAQTLDVPFFGRSAPTPSGPARIALRYGIPALPVALGWDEQQGRHLVRWLPALDSNPGLGQATDPSPAEMVRFLSGCNSALEELLRRNPAGWVWFHDRWGIDTEPGKEAGE